MKAYRLVSIDYSASAFSGQGAYLYGGRWNSPGTCVVYLSSNIALAVLESLAYRKAKKRLSNKVLFTVTFQNKHIETLQSLPKNWHDYPHPSSTQSLGDTWAKDQKSLVLRVPSVLVNQEYNYLLNCQHPDFAHIKITGPEPFLINPRLSPDAN